MRVEPVFEFDDAEAATRSHSGGTAAGIAEFEVPEGGSDGDDDYSEAGSGARPGVLAPPLAAFIGVGIDRGGAPDRRYQRAGKGDEGTVTRLRGRKRRADMKSVSDPLRLVAPVERSDATIAYLEGTPSVISLVRLPGAAQKAQRGPDPV
ncbi:MAG: hypothetical protein IPN07_07085 [Dehalococcoidia bacterium]|nr:hypothetical protein [Dehalococcoidia bacterium]